MLIGFFSDIHANIDALSATLDVLDRLAIRRIYCVGDVVGYGGAPSECIDLMRERNIPCVRGNHDEYTAYPDSFLPQNVRAEARRVIAWNREVLRPDQLDWLAQLPLTLDEGDFMITHASCQPTPRWMYIITPHAATMHLLFQPKRLCFTAHSHVPVIATHRRGHPVNLDYLKNMTLPKEATVMVGVGAIGQPRDEDPRCCVVLYNTDSDAITVLRIKYDVVAAQKRILDKGLPTFLATRLSKGQ